MTALPRITERGREQLAWAVNIYTDATNATAIRAGAEEFSKQIESVIKMGLESGQIVPYKGWPSSSYNAILVVQG